MRTSIVKIISRCLCCCFWVGPIHCARAQPFPTKHRLAKLVSFLPILLFAASAAAANFNYEVVELEGSDYWYRNEFWKTFLGVIITFVAPYFIAKRQGDDFDDGEQAFLYYKWFFIFVAGLIVVVILGFRSTLAFLIVNIGIAVYGIFFSKKKVSVKEKKTSEAAVQVTVSREIRANSYIDPTWSAMPPKALPKVALKGSGSPLGVRFKDPDEWLKMVAIPSGTFLMGSTGVVNGPEPCEQPQHRVTVQSFMMGKFQVTQDQWYAVMGTWPSHFKGRTLPVEQVSWDDAKEFVKKLSEKTGKTYRLPSEAEWEYAARGGSQTDFCFGNDAWANLHDYAWFCDNSNGLTHPCGEKLPNAFGLHDMHGNVWEWTEDCWKNNYNDAPTDGSAWGSDNCPLRVRRGGSWDYEYFFKEGARLGRELYLPTSALRAGLSSESRINSVGFRVVNADENPTPIGEKPDRTIHGQVDSTPLPKTKVSAPLINQTIREKSDRAVHGRAIFTLEGETPAINYDKNGQHTVTFPNGDKYIGEFRDKKPNGLGTYNFVDGRKYVGEFLNGGINGKGEYFFVGGHKYCGEHIDGNFNGRGTLTLADGRKYIGEFRDDRFHGHGTYKLANGDKYVGEWADDKYDEKFEKINAFKSLSFHRDVAPKSFQSSKNIKKTKRSIYRGVKSLKEDDSPKSNDRNLVQPRFIKNTIEVATHEGVGQERPIPATGLLKSKKKWCLAGSELLNVQTGEKFLVVDKLSLNRQEIRREGTGYVFAPSSTYAYVSDWYIETR